MGEILQNLVILAKNELNKHVRTKKCSKCYKTLPTSEFGANSTTYDGFQTWCRTCRNQVHVDRRKKDLAHRIQHHFHTRMTEQLGRCPGGVPENLWANMETYLGYTFRELKHALNSELRAREGIGLKEGLIHRGYHIDHIRPLASFVIVSVNDPTFRECWAISNLKAIPSADNLAKGSRYEAFVEP